MTAEHKDTARRTVLDFLPQASLPRLAVRINALTTRNGLADLLALAEAPVCPRLILVPKVQAAAELRIAAGVVGDERAGFVPIIESAEGLAYVLEIARAPRCVGVLFGGGDLSAELGVSMNWEALFAPRAATVQACARGLACLRPLNRRLSHVQLRMRTRTCAGVSVP